MRLEFVSPFIWPSVAMHAVIAMYRRPILKSLAFLGGGLAVAIVGIVIVAVLFPTAKWVGFTDLQIRFVVVDADSGRPLPSATVHIRAEGGGFCDEQDASEFTLTTNSNGHAEYLSTGCMCFGSQGLLENDFGIHLPYWWIHATAEGYAAGEPAFLDVTENVKQVKRGTSAATLEIPIGLRKNGI